MLVESMKIVNFSFKSRQQGAVTLIVVVILALLMAVVALTTARSGIVEQQLTGNDIRAREAQEAAEAGLEYGAAWAKKHPIPHTVLRCVSGSLPAGCPTALPAVSGSTTHETYAYDLVYAKGANSIKVTSTAIGVADSTITSTSEAFVKQIPILLFDTGMTMPPPWVIAGCITNAPTGTPGTFVLNAGNVAVIGGTSSDPACLQQGHLDVTTWNDANGNVVKDAGEVGAVTAFNRGGFTGCPGTNCAWNHVFHMPLQAAKDMATAAGHAYNGLIPCGPAAEAPSIYVINNDGPLNPGDITGTCTGTGVNNTTIGAPNQPILLIVPSAHGCPKFNGGITIYGIVYYESATACAANGWGGATIYGSVIWEGNVDKPNANSEFIEVDYENKGPLNEVFNVGMDDATRVPGTWKDF